MRRNIYICVYVCVYVRVCVWRGKIIEGHDMKTRIRNGELSVVGMKKYKREGHVLQVKAHG